MTIESLQDTIEGSGPSTVSVVERGRDSVAPVEHTEPDGAWFDDPDAHFTEINDYLRRLYRRCGSSDEFIAALNGLLPDLRERVDRVSAGYEVAFGWRDEADATAELGPGRWVCFRSTAEMVAADLARLADPGGRDPSRPPDEAWFDDPDAHLTEVVDYMKRLHLRCDTADEFVGALKGMFPDLREKVDRSLALQEELRDLDDDELPDPDDDIAAGRSIIYLSGAEMIAADLAEELEDSIPGAGD